MINLKKGEKGKLPKFIASSWQKDLATLWSGCKSNGGNLKTSQKLRGLQFQAINKCQMARSSRAIQDWKDWTYWKVLKISDSTDAVQETSDASTYVISHKECTQAGREVPCFVAHRQPHDNRLHARCRLSLLRLLPISVANGLTKNWQSVPRKKKLKWDIMGDPMGFESELFVYLPQHLPWWVFKVFPDHKWALPRQGRCFAICQHPSGKLLAWQPHFNLDLRCASQRRTAS